MSESDVGTERAPRKKSPAPRSSSRALRTPAAESLNGQTSDAAELQRELDRVSLTQALIDTEAATARVIDLTERLVDARQQIIGLRRELEEARIEYHQLRAEHEMMKGSMAFRLATTIWNLRNAIRP